MQKYLNEFFGTTVFLTSILMALAGKVKGVPPSVLIGIALTICIEANKLSGAHYNPAVSLMALKNGALSSNDFPYYVIAQAIGAMAALELYTAITKS